MSVLWQHRRSNQQEALGFFGVEGIGAKKSKIKASCRIGTRVLRVKASSNSGVSSPISTAIPTLDSFMSCVVISHELVFRISVSVDAVRHHATSFLQRLCQPPPPAWQKCSTRWQAGRQRPSWACKASGHPSRDQRGQRARGVSDIRGGVLPSRSPLREHLEPSQT